MGSTEKGISVEKMHENSLMMNTIEVLDDEKQSILTEILRCVVCLELPVGKQVRICEKGHHFCRTCHKNMKACGVCRGQLLESRNFVVEDLVTKLAPILGISRYTLPIAGPPCPLSQGFFKCPHQCLAKIPASLMLSHLRKHHSANLIDNVRSNPYSGQFSFSFKIYFFSNKKFIWSAQVSDMGLFTVELSFLNSDFCGCVRMLVNKTVALLYRYQLVVKILKAKSESFLEFSVSNSPVSSYLDDIETVITEGNGLKIKGHDLLEHIETGSAMTVFFAVWKNQESIASNKRLPPSVVCLPEKCMFFKNDRKIRRNRNRNIRRKRLKESLKNSQASNVMWEKFSSLVL